MRHSIASASPLVNLACVAIGNGDPATSLRAVLLRGVQALEAAPGPRDRQAATLLRAYYVQRTGSHEVLVERFGLPRTTFYRRLKQGLALLAAWLRIEDAATTRPVGDTDERWAGLGGQANAAEAPRRR